MNYEDLYTEYQAISKELKDKNAQVQRLTKTINKEIENGDLKGFDKDSLLLSEASAAQAEILGRIRELIGSFDRTQYFTGGDFAAQMLEACRENGVDVRGEFPIYEMFPYKVRFDAENLDLYMDRKKVHCLRPASFVAKIKDGQTRLMKASFNASTFVNELAEAYDMALLKLKKRPETDIYLTKLYKILAPMSRYRRDYDQQSYAFDLARLYMSDVEQTKDGRRFQFGPSRNNNQAIRILDANGNEQFLATIKFFRE
ncbi:MAG: hypothetical protein LUC41_01080 [Clostridiales bacterium]|nr:hypothetical protein [Clostridiales bacterium]